eukprot:TRINITY_DN65568_c0_g1_i1.p1 TRINITY_DN65568_c0_g1~~TRINITY_DN65568_c0_g1_i1.p1  ORF type:complete len:683 (+),score=176.56 TRINITY_DN65568_c0_g1_i1:89-2137(+)
MRGDSGEVLRLAAAVAVGVWAARLLWSKLRSSRPKEEVTIAKDASPTNGSSGSRPDEGLWIYFGSQSGTAEGFAKELEEEAAGHEISATVVDMEDFEPDVFQQHKAVVLVVATYGEGDPPDNAVEFYKWLQDESLSGDLLKGMSFTVMGLGNRQYVHFNACSKVADKEMERLGAMRVHERGEGDDDQNIEEDFEQWKGNGLWPALCKVMGVGGEATADSNALETPEAILKRLPLRVELAEQVKQLPVDPLVQVGGADVLGKWYFNASLAPVCVCDELRQLVDIDAGKTTKHIEFNVKQLPAVDWRTADNLEVLPQNPDAEVEWFAQRLGVLEQLESNLTFLRAEGMDKPVKKPFPAPCTVRSALSIYCDLCAAPNKTAAKRFASLARDAADREALEALLQDREAYQALTGEKGRLSLRQFFELYMTSAELDLSTFLQLCPRQKSRPYTIASSSKEDPSRIAICVSLVQEEVPSVEALLKELEERGYAAPRGAAYLQELGAQASQPRRFRGITTEMLCTQVTRGQKLWIYARASTFRLPRRTTTPIIMLGAGTGLAPFRGFAREFRAEQGSRTRTLLFFGCTKQNEDFIYREELEEAVKMEPPALKELVTAFSREQAHKVYVQHRLKERAAEVKQLIGDGAYIYVCGAVNMGKAVRDELVTALGSADYVDRLQTEGRYVEELW